MRPARAQVRAAWLSKRVARERREEALPGGAFGTYWRGGSVREREDRRRQLLRQWDDLESEVEALRRQAEGG
jgi:hypothetical protein